MANTLQIKRSTASGTGNPGVDDLAYGELAWNNGQNRLFIGRQAASTVTAQEVGPRATSAVPGLASFSSDDFDVSEADYATGAGSAVTIKEDGVSNDQLANPSLTIGSSEFTLGATALTSIEGLTALDFAADTDVVIGDSVGDGNSITLGGDVGSTVIVAGNLQVDGTTTTVNSTTVTVDDKTFVLGSGSDSAALAAGGIIWGNETTPVASITWSHANTRLVCGDIQGTLYGNAESADTAAALTGDQADAIDANTAKVGITTAQASAITTNSGKTGITSTQASAITANTAKVGITTSQASAISTNSAKVGITSTQASAITANTAKTGITSTQASAIATNSGKVGITSTQASAIAANTLKVGITSTQASAITTNTGKTGITTTQANAITANTSKVTNANHTGDVTGDGALSITNLAVTTGKIASEAVTAGKLATDSVTNTKIADLAVRRAHINDDEVSYAKVQNVVSDNRILGNVSGDNKEIEELDADDVWTFLGTVDGGGDVDWS